MSANASWDTRHRVGLARRGARTHCAGPAPRTSASRAARARSRSRRTRSAVKPADVTSPTWSTSTTRATRTRPDPADRPGRAPTESNSPLVAEGDQDSATKTLADGRYLISIRSPDHKMWGKHITLPGRRRRHRHRDAQTTPCRSARSASSSSTTTPGRMARRTPRRAASAGFHVTIEEQTNYQVSVDYFNHPLCGGDCITESDGFVQLDNLGPATYFIYVTPPDGLRPRPRRHVDPDDHDRRRLRPAGGRRGGQRRHRRTRRAALRAPDRRTGLLVRLRLLADGFRRAPGTGSISGRALNWVGWPPFDVLIPTRPSPSPTRTSRSATPPPTAPSTSAKATATATSTPERPGRHLQHGDLGRADQLHHPLPARHGRGDVVRASTLGDGRRLALVRLARRRRLLRHQQERRARRAASPHTEHRRRPALARRLDQGGDLHRRRRALRVPTAEGGPLGKFFIGEVGFARFGTSGAAVHDEYERRVDDATSRPTSAGACSPTSS